MKEKKLNIRWGLGPRWELRTLVNPNTFDTYVLLIDNVEKKRVELKWSTLDGYDSLLKNIEDIVFRKQRQRNEKINKLIELI